MRLAGNQHAAGKMPGYIFKHAWCTMPPTAPCCAAAGSSHARIAVTLEGRFPEIEQRELLDSVVRSLLW